MGIVYTLEHIPSGRIYVGYSKHDNALKVKEGLEVDLSATTSARRKLGKAWKESDPEEFVFTVHERHPDTIWVNRAKVALWQKLSSDHELLNDRAPKAVRRRRGARFVDLTETAQDNQNAHTPTLQIPAADSIIKPLTTSVNHLS